MNADTLADGIGCPSVGSGSCENEAGRRFGAASPSLNGR
jgi:hypothetical protein